MHVRPVQSAILLLALCTSALAQIGEKPASCTTSFGFIYTDKLGNKYESVRGKELREIQARLSKKQHGRICIIDSGAPDYVFAVQAFAKTRVVNGTEYPYTEYVLEVHRGGKPFELIHTFSRSTRLGRASESESPIISLVEDAAAYLEMYPSG
ncbi:MAG TPA: hypothetical protein VJQ59_13690 [Candidatus Sulfotelmatobacter sp.]|nr:hypothetical protein [Candidatus Sulfotelmatobacter sp.]